MLHLGSYCTQLDHAVKHHDGPQLAHLVALDGKHAHQLLDWLARPDRGPARADRTLDQVRLPVSPLDASESSPRRLGRDPDLPPPLVATALAKLRRPVQAHFAQGRALGRPRHQPRLVPRRPQRPSPSPPPSLRPTNSQLTSRLRRSLRSTRRRASSTARSTPSLPTRSSTRPSRPSPSPPPPRSRSPALTLSTSCTCSALYRWLIDARDLPTGWALPLLYVVCRDLRKTAEMVRPALSASPSRSSSPPWIKTDSTCRSLRYAGRSAAARQRAQGDKARGREPPPAKVLLVLPQRPVRPLLQLFPHADRSSLTRLWPAERPT